MHLVESQFKLIIQNVFGDEVAYFDSHVALVVVEELARVVGLDHFLDGEVD